MPRNVDLSSLFLSQDWWEANIRPKQILNQKFATVLSDEDLSDADIHVHKGFKIRPRMPASMKASGSSEVKIDKDGFQVSLNLDEFELGELSVKKFDRFVEVHGKHGEKRDQYGLVSREFRRRYMVPYNCDIEALTSSFSTDYKLTIKAPASQKERRLINLPMKVPVVEKEFNPPVMELIERVSRLHRNASSNWSLLVIKPGSQAFR
ncbi:Protein lethal(2)essential for life [Araneus ventricosus]|uniref:Protein lethal(2)essential for life n=1 Tax=Araneus ventricosus TaxID=182803 RepID=A0A4Y2FG38_ARAVE|nr:Protein lethal(2)essential for life [Araneus ventricosus]